MRIHIKNKYLSIDNYKVKCAIGKRGINVKKKEGDLITPRGLFKIKFILYRKDRISNLKTKIKKIAINKSMGWCDDPRSVCYNKLINLPFKYSAEKLHRTENTYDIILVLNYNMSPIIKNKGSAIFIHIAKNNFKKTAGCIAIRKISIKKIASMINKKTLVKIS
tara:strand:- start:344 stop:835 length:492 start_codon:yes stop_codon:yes gene_type:complete